jgi:hypothetical protein
MADATVRFEIGFSGGGATSGQADVNALKALEDAITAGTQTVLPLESESTRLLVRVSEVAWIRIHGSGKRVGF